MQKSVKGTTIPTAVCQVCGEEKPLTALMPAELVRPSLAATIEKHFSGWKSDGHICLADLSKYRKEYLREQLADELGELSALDNEVLESLHQREVLSDGFIR